MELVTVDGVRLKSLGQMNVILGKNGCGKSHLLKRTELTVRADPSAGVIRYISPERAGYAIYEPHIEANMSSSADWMFNARSNNQSENFKQQSAVLYRRLETMVLREVEKDRTLPGFSGTVGEINSLLDRVKIERTNSTFTIREKSSGLETNAKAISSGESELLSLAIEVLAFRKECIPGKINYLLFDEPDVHLHPDLQYRFAQFVLRNLSTPDITVIIATHSTPLLGAFADSELSRVAFMTRGAVVLEFHPITDAYRNILPIFGAHPLSNVFNSAPILLLEGEDDERVWQQAIRSAKGLIKAFPCPVEGISMLGEYEADANEIIAAVYDDAIGYSIRDRDTDPEEIDDLHNILRMRLSCRAAENLMLADDTLSIVGKNWTALQLDISEWLKVNTAHIYFDDVDAFASGGFSRKDADLKNIRNILVGLITNKPWEVLVGQSIATLAKSGGSSNAGSLRDFLGEKICELLLRVK